MKKRETRPSPAELRFRLRDAHSAVAHLHEARVLLRFAPPALSEVMAAIGAAEEAVRQAELLVAALEQK